MDGRLATEVTYPVPACEQLAESRAGSQQSLRRENPEKLLVGHNQLVAGVEVLQRGVNTEENTHTHMLDAQNNTYA